MSEAEITAETFAQAEQQRAEAADAGDAGDASRRLCVLQAGETWLALEADGVEEITRHPDRLTAVPGAPDYIPGLMVLRGRPLALLHLADYLDLAPAASDDLEARVVVVRFGAMRVGCICDRVAGVVAVHDHALGPADAVTGRRLAPHALNTFDRGDALVVVVDMASLLRAARAT